MCDQNTTNMTTRSGFAMPLLPNGSLDDFDILEQSSKWSFKQELRVFGHTDHPLIVSLYLPQDCVAINLEKT